MSETNERMIADLTVQHESVVQALDSTIDHMIAALEAVRTSPDLGWGSIGGTTYGQVVALAAQASTLKDQINAAEHRKMGL